MGVGKMLSSVGPVQNPLYKLVGDNDEQRLLLLLLWGNDKKSSCPKTKVLDLEGKRFPGLFGALWGSEGS